MGDLASVSGPVTDVPLRHCEATSRCLVSRWKKNNFIIAPYSLVKIDICMLK